MKNKLIQNTFIFALLLLALIFNSCHSLKAPEDNKGDSFFSLNQLSIITCCNSN